MGRRRSRCAGAIGFVLFLIGYFLASREWRRNDGKKRAAPITFPIKEQDRGQTTLNTASLSHALEGDLRTIPNVSGAMVGLFGMAPGDRTTQCPRRDRSDRSQGTSEAVR